MGGGCSTTGSWIGLATALLTQVPRAMSSRAWGGAQEQHHRPTRPLRTAQSVTCPRSPVPCWEVLAASLQVIGWPVLYLEEGKALGITWPKGGWGGGGVGAGIFLHARVGFWSSQLPVIKNGVATREIRNARTHARTHARMPTRISGDAPLYPLPCARRPAAARAARRGQVRRGEGRGGGIRRLAPHRHGGISLRGVHRCACCAALCRDCWPLNAAAPDHGGIPTIAPPPPLGLFRRKGMEQPMPPLQP